MTARYENPLFGGPKPGQAPRRRRSTTEEAPSWHNGYILIDKKASNLERLLLSEGLTHGALAVRDDQEVQHFRIDEQGLYTIAGSSNKFSALQDLVTFYRQP